MNDLISRQDAIDAVIKRDANCGIDSAEVLKNMPSAELPIKEKCCVCPYCDNCDVNEDGTIERKKVEWIPCSEYLPMDFEDVLVWYEYFRYGDYNRMYQTYGIGNYDSLYDIWGGDVNGHKARAIAWMPLPAPYKESEVDE